MMALRIFIFTILASALAVCAGAQPVKYDVIVYGGTSSGVIAAYTAAKDGMKTALIERTSHVGGLTTSGIGNVDIGWPRTVGGYTAEFLRTVGAHYGNPHKMQISLECKVAEQVFDAWLEEAGVDVFFHKRLREKGGVTKNGSRIVSITMEDGSVYAAPVFIDASYEGDLMAQAGVSYITGRESREEFGESSAGVGNYMLLRKYAGKELDMVKQMSVRYPFDIVLTEKDETGSADTRTQAYCYRLTVTDNPENMVPFRKPEGYDPERYFNTLYRIGRRKAVRLDQVLTLYPLPNGKYDLNHMDLINASWSYPEADYQEREYIDLYHRRYQEGMLYFLGHDERVPEELRKDVLRYGLAKDEYTDNGNWPYQLYIREGRRMRGEYVMRQQDAWDNPFKDDAVAVGSYFLDCHIVSSIVDSEGRHLEEGVFPYTPYRPYEIPYRTITPKKEECTNLLVPVCMSASHVICASLRMEPVYMMLGQAAGDAARLAVTGGTAVQDIDVEELQTILRKQKQLLHFKVPSDMYLTADRFDGIIMDDSEIALHDDIWYHSTSQGPFMKYDYRFSTANPQGQKKAVFKPELARKGRYEVQIMYSPSGNRTKSADVTVYDKRGAHARSVDMTAVPEVDGLWHSLGTFTFDQKSDCMVVFTDRGEGGIVVVDAVRFIKK